MCTSFKRIHHITPLTVVPYQGPVPTSEPHHSYNIVPLTYKYIYIYTSFSFFFQGCTRFPFRFYSFKKRVYKMYGWGSTRIWNLLDALFLWHIHCAYNILRTYVYISKYKWPSVLFKAPSDEFIVVFSLGCHSTTKYTSYIFLSYWNKLCIV